MKKIQKLISLAFLGISMLLVPSLASCNSKTESEDPYYELSTNVGVTSFNLKADSKVMSNLDSVFFSIDIERSVIFNADSLPKGTDISGIIPVIKYPESASKAEIVQTGGKRDGTTDYKSNPNDTVDFNANVVFNVTAQDGTTTRSYRLKVNVHNMVPDSIVWGQVAISKLPSRMPNPVNQKTVLYKGNATSIIKESDGSHTLSVNPDIFKEGWNKQVLDLPFTPDIRTFTASENALFILSDSGDLYTSANGEAWNPTGRCWKNIIGDYQGRLLGLRESDGILTHTEYPDGRETTASKDFPVDGYSNFVISSNKWTETPSAMITGGRKADGSLTDATWGFDGSIWAHIDNGKLPKILAPSIVPYYSYRQSTSSWLQNIEYNVWLCLGGRLADGTYNSVTYISFDNGVTWKEADTLMNIPNFIPGMAFSDAIVITAPYSASIADGWTSKSASLNTRISYDIDGLDIKWNCPYIFLFGGEDSSNILCDTIWRGVLARLTFAPII